MIIILTTVRFALLIIEDRANTDSSKMLPFIETVKIDKRTMQAASAVTGIS